MRIFRTLLLSACTAGLLAGCGGSGTSGGSVNTSAVHGTLIQNPPLRTASVTAADLTAQFAASTNGGATLLALVSPLGGLPSNSLPCGIDYHYIQYNTVGGAGEPTTATGVMMVPTGSSTQCTNPQGNPILLFAHGTTTDKTFNLANVAANTSATGVSAQEDPGNETAALSAFFAAQGYIVVAPNYAGYDTSSLSYHPYVNYVQQSNEMIDALTAARFALGKIFASGIKDNGQLFISGYSQGGYVAMATHKAMQARYLAGDATMKVTASAPMSGPYALAAMADQILFGDVDAGGTTFMPMLLTSYQRAYGNIYNIQGQSGVPGTTSDVYASPYASIADNIFPSANPTAAAASLPGNAMFDSASPSSFTWTGVPDNSASITPLLTTTLMESPFYFFATYYPAATVTAYGLNGFDPTHFLVSNTFRASYLADAYANPDGALNMAGGIVVPQISCSSGLLCAAAASPQHTTRIALKANDLRGGWTPAAPVQMCGGHSDPTVFFPVNTGTMQKLWSSNPYVSVVDADPTSGNLLTTATLSIPTPVSPPTAQSVAQGVFYNVASGVIAQGAATSPATPAPLALLATYHALVTQLSCLAATNAYFSAFTNIH